MLWPRDQSRFTKQIRGGHDLLALRKGRRRAAPGQAIAFWPARLRCGRDTALSVTSYSASCVLPALTDHGVRGGGPVASGVRLRAPRQQGSAALAIRHRLAAVAVGPTHAHAYSTTKARMARCGSPRPADRQRRTTHPRAADMGGIRWRRRPGDYERSGCVRRHVPRCGRRAQATPTRRRTP